MKCTESQSKSRVSLYLLIHGIRDLILLQEKVHCFIQICIVRGKQQNSTPHHNNASR